MLRIGACLIGVLACGALAAEVQHRLVFGSFAEPVNAERWATSVGSDLTLETEVQPVANNEGTMYRVVSAPLSDAELDRIRQRARGAGFDAWRLAEPGSPTTTGPPTMAEAARSVPPVRQERVLGQVNDDPSREFDIDVCVQARSYWDTGLDGQSRFQPSLSGSFRYRRYFNDDRDTFTLRPFGRLDAEDDERTHADLREAYYGHADDTWELNVGVQHVF